MTATVPGRVILSPQQHTSHKSLLDRVDARHVPPADLDAIVVPTSRPASFLRNAITAAKSHNVQLVLLCSKESQASTAILEAKKVGALAVAFDTDSFTKDVLVPQFATCGLLAKAGFERRTDTSFKRNFGLLIATLAGWKNILFLDDDICLPDPDDLRAAAGLLDRGYEVVGLDNAGMPDNSVVCKASRDAGAPQDTFIGGGALATADRAFDSFFPNIYNEDWFFLLDGDRLRSSALTGRAEQSFYDPYRHPGRARAEELGDTLAEGIFSLLDNEQSLARADIPYWAEFLSARRQFIEDALRRVKTSGFVPDLRERMTAALDAALDQNKLIRPALCADYLEHWQADRRLWRTHLENTRSKHGGDAGLDAVFDTLKIKDFAQSS